MKILILASNPRKDLNLDREIRDLTDVIERSRNREQFEVEDALAVRAGDLQDLLLQHQPDVVHFCGHGGGEAGLVLESDNGKEHFVETEALRDLFRLFSGKVKCVLLNACYSDEQASEIVNYIDYVIGMNQEIRDDAAIAFSKGFYRALGYGCSIEEAYAFGCNAIQLEICSHATVRSALGATVDQSTSADLSRKAEVVEAVKTTIIPEHVKPILKKRAASVNESEFNSLLSRDKKAELQRKLAQEVMRPPSENAIVQPDPEPSSISSAPASPARAELSVAASHPRRLLPWLLAGLVAVTLPAIGVYSYRQSSDPSTSPNSGQVEGLPSSQPTASPGTPSPNQSDQALLDQAKALADQQQWKDAIATLQSIAAESSVAAQAKTYLAEWSTQLLTQARSLYDQGDLDAALTAAQGIPANSPDYEQAQSAIAAWATEKQIGEQLWAVLNNQWDVQGSRQMLSQIQSPGFHEILKAEIEATEVKILASAQTLYADGKQDEAIQKAQIIPEGSPSYAEAQSLIAAWTTELPPEDSTPEQPVYDYSWLAQYNWLADRSITEADLQDKNAVQLDILRNSLFARRGLKFTNPELQRAYQSQDWYQPTDISSQEVYDQLSEQEWQNVRAICTYQKQNNLSLNQNLNCG